MQFKKLILGIRDAAKIKAIMGILDDETLTAVIAFGDSLRSGDTPACPLAHLGKRRSAS